MGFINYVNNKLKLHDGYNSNINLIVHIKRETKDKYLTMGVKIKVFIFDAVLGKLLLIPFFKFLLCFV